MGSLFKPKKVVLPEETGNKAPVADDAQLQAEKRKAESKKKRGRASTILGGSYTAQAGDREKLG